LPTHLRGQPRRDPVAVARGDRRVELSDNFDRLGHLLLLVARKVRRHVTTDNARFVAGNVTYGRIVSREGPATEAVALSGGRLTAGVVRVGGTVRRPTGPHSPFVHELLAHLEAVGFAGAPRLLGVDDQGRARSWAPSMAGCRRTSTTP
jgi:hypothetical protein